MSEIVQWFREEVAELDALLEDVPFSDWGRVTPFKAWTIWDVVAHLHWTDRQALSAIRDRDAFAREGERMRTAMKAGTPLLAYTRDSLGDPEASVLREQWRRDAEALCDAASPLDETTRIPWYGPDMSLRMFVVARQMETWAHAQDVFDLLAQPRVYGDRLRGIAELGVRTFGWTFANRRLPVPAEKPHVRLEAPSGAFWEWNAPRTDERIEGRAADFCHVVTQGRHVHDTNLRVEGETARAWMSMAQCFAGPPEDPPEAGSRVREGGAR